MRLCRNRQAARKTRVRVQGFSQYVRGGDVVQSKAQKPGSPPGSLHVQDPIETPSHDPLQECISGGECEPIAISPFPFVAGLTV
jgi:hypothetical protein